MTDARDELAALILEAIRADVGDYVRPLPDDEYYSEDLSSCVVDAHFIDMRAVADAILAAGWRPPGPVYVALKHGWTCSDVVGVYSTAEAAEAAHPLDDVEAHAVEC